MIIASRRKPGLIKHMWISCFHDILHKLYYFQDIAIPGSKNEFVVNLYYFFPVSTFAITPLGVM